MFPSGNLIRLGQFELTTPVMRVSDPCYDKDVWCCGTISRCEIGLWESALVQSTSEDEWMSGRVKAIIARHTEDAPEFDQINSCFWQAPRRWHEAPFTVGVDSGQAGFFDEAHYQDNSIFDEMGDPSCHFGDPWYNWCCSMTLNDLRGGVIPYGALSSSGFGDGSYCCFFHRNDKRKIDCAIIVFIDDSEEHMIETEGEANE